MEKVHVKHFPLSSKTLRLSQNLRDTTRGPQTGCTGAVVVPVALCSAKGLAPDRCLIHMNPTKSLPPGGDGPHGQIQPEVKVVRAVSWSPSAY